MRKFHPWGASALTLLLAAGCGTGAGPTAHAERSAPAGDRHVLGAPGAAGFEQVLATQPAEIAAEDAERLLVRIDDGEVAHEQRYGVLQFDVGRFPWVGDDFRYRRSGAYYMPYYRSGAFYYPYSHVRVLYPGHGGQLYSPYYYRMGHRYWPWAYSTPPRPHLPQRHVLVSIERFEFMPANTRVPRGGTVAWTNRDAVVHDATADPGVRPFTTGPLHPGRTSAPITFGLDGTFGYHCSYHPRMRGSVTAGDAPAISSPQDMTGY